MIFNQRGQGVTEYALLLASVVLIGAVLSWNGYLGTAVQEKFEYVAAVINGSEVPGGDNGSDNSGNDNNPEGQDPASGENGGHNGDNVVMANVGLDKGSWSRLHIVEKNVNILSRLHSKELTKLEPNTTYTITFNPNNIPYGYDVGYMVYSKNDGHSDLVATTNSDGISSTDFGWQDSSTFRNGYKFTTGPEGGYIGMNFKKSNGLAYLPSQKRVMENAVANDFVVTKN